MNNAVCLLVVMISLTFACRLALADEAEQIFGPIDRLIEPKFKTTTDKMAFAMDNLKKLQAAAEAYAAHHGGKFPTKVDNAFKSYFPLGEADDKNFSPFSAFLNPFSKKKEWPIYGLNASTKEEAISETNSLKPGTLEYSPIKNGSDYLIRVGGADGKPLRKGGRVVSLSHEPIESAKANMRTLQWSAESYAEHHSGSFPKQVNDDFKIFFPGGDVTSHRIGRPLVNPFTGRAEWPVAGTIANLKTVRNSAPSKLAPGVLEYSCVEGGRLYAIRCGAANGKAIPGLTETMKSTLVLGKDGDGAGHFVSY
jgi:hypothetical protein